MSDEQRPDLKGIAGRAWIIAKPDPPTSPDHAATLEMYLLDVPGAHAFWHRWALYVIHLRELPGQTRPAHITLPGATHELMIVSIDPDWSPDFAKRSLGFEDGVPFLTPPDVVQQFIVRDDADARQLAGLCVRCIVDGRLSPDQDWRRVWAGTIATTAAHIREGRHPTS